MTGAAKLNRRAALQRSTVTPNDFNELIETWSTFATVWTDKRDVSASEGYRSQEVGAKIDARFTIRYSSQVADLNPRDRLIFDGTVYEILGVREIQRNRIYELDCVARSDATAAVSGGSSGGSPSPGSPSPPPGSPSPGSPSPPPGSPSPGSPSPGSPGGGFDPDAAAIIARYSPAPDADQQNRINNLVIALKATSTNAWNKLDSLQVLAAHSDQRIDWKNANITPSLIGAPTHQPYIGWTTDGIDDAYNTGFDPSVFPGPGVGANNWQLNDASFGVWSLTDAQQVNSFAGRIPTSGAAASIQNRNTSDAFRVRVNTASASGNFGSTTGIGFFVAARGSGTIQKGYRNGALFLNISSASSAVVAGTLLLGATSTTSFAAATYALFYAGPDFSDVEHDEIYQAFLAYMNAIP